MDDFHVNYTVETPWTTPPYVRITRRVIVDDIDECSFDVAKYTEKCPPLLPQCDTSAGAKCINTVGSYSCQCPKFTSGDGFMKDASFANIYTPKGYLGGTSCVDNHRPTIRLLGPQPKKFKVCKCGGLGRLTASDAEVSTMDAGMEELCTTQRDKYDSQLRELIKSTGGAELCATGGNPNPRPSYCVNAADETHVGIVNLTSLVAVGDPVQKSEFAWSVPYSVSDVAGNEAKRVWRDVVVEEVDLFDLESKVYADVFAEKEQEIARAVEKALEDERKNREALDVVPVTSKARKPRKTTTASEQQCPACPLCECNNMPTTDFDKERCDLYCERKVSEVRASCGAHSRFFEFFETTVPNTLFWAGFCIFALLVFIIFLRLLSTLAFNPGALMGRRQRDFQASSPAPSGYHRAVDDTPLYNRRGPDAGGGLFSPPESRGYAQSSTSPFLGTMSPQTPAGRRSNDSIYADNGIITPNRDGLLRRHNGR
uniref:EGF-like calcium-binding domain-containing protein n=1 Tax=Grammatophora oceanica TaxID=210454 RepID=A0A7S1VQV2_9STRA